MYSTTACRGVLRYDENAQGPIVVLALLLAVLGVGFLIAGYYQGTQKCWALSLYLYAAACPCLGIDGTIVFKTKWFAIGGTAVGAILVIVAAIFGTFAGVC